VAAVGKNCVKKEMTMTTLKFATLTRVVRLSLVSSICWLFAIAPSALRTTEAASPWTITSQATRVSDLSDPAFAHVSITPAMVALAKAAVNGPQYYLVPGREIVGRQGQWEYPFHIEQRSRGSVVATQVGVDDNAHVAAFIIGSKASVLVTKKLRANSSRFIRHYNGEGCTFSWYTSYPYQNTADSDTKWYDTTNSSIVVADVFDFIQYCYNGNSIHTAAYGWSYPTPGCAWSPGSASYDHGIVNNNTSSAYGYTLTNYSGCHNSYCSIDYQPSEPMAYITYVGWNVNTHIYSPNNNFNCTSRYMPQYTYTNHS